MTRPVAAFLTSLLLVATLTACDALSQGVQSNTNVLARAAGRELTIDEAIELLANQSQLPNQPEVVTALAHLWIDYTLLATVVNQDTSLQSFDLSPVVRSDLDQLLVYKLRDSVIRPDTSFSEEELRRLFEEELPGARIRARHILLDFPDQATPAQRDSVTALAQSLRERAEGGEDFGALAREYSDDQGNADEGGDLGWFRRGEMVRPFEEAAFATEVGQLSEPVESPYGVHVIKVDDRQAPSFEEGRTQFWGRLVNQRVFAAESAYVGSLEEPAEITIPDDAFEVAKGLARRPEVRLSNRAGERALVRYRGGKVSAGEFRQYIQARPPGYRAQVAQGQDQQVETLLRALTRAELLLNAAKEEGIEVTESERDSLLLQARNRVVLAASTMDLWPVEPEAGEPMAEAVDRTVMTTLEEILAGQEDVLPLGSIAYALREEFNAEVFAHAVGRVVEGIEAASPRSSGRPRMQRPIPGRPPLGTLPAPAAPPDTTGG